MSQQRRVYFIRALGVGYIKIGSSLEPHLRFNQMQVQCPVDLELVCHAPGYRPDGAVT